MKHLLFTCIIGIISFNLFAQTDILPPQLVSPIDKAVKQMPQTELNWYAVSGVGPVMYKIEVSLSDNFTNPNTYNTELSAVTLENLKFGTTYFWHVKAQDNLGESGWSDTFSFTVMYRLELSKPNDGAEDAEPDEEVSWRSTIGGSVLAGFNKVIVQVDTAIKWVDANQNVSNGDFLDVSYPALNDIWVVGSGPLLHYNGNQWMENSEINDGNSIDMINENHGWIVDDDGNMHYYNGEVWDERNLNDVIYVDDGAWVIGQNGNILHYDGNTWQKAMSPVLTDLNSISFDMENDGWIVGENGKILQFDESSSDWMDFESPTNNNLYSVYTMDSTTAWAVGDSGIIIRLDTTWKIQDSVTNYHLYSVDFVPTGMGWAVGRNMADSFSQVLYYDGNSWNIQEDSVNRLLFSVSAIDTNNVWITSLNMNQDSTFIYHYDGSAWMMDAAFSGKYVNIKMISQSNGWASGSGNKVLHYDGTSWSTVNLPGNYEVQGLAFSGSTGLGVGMNGLVMMLSEESWTQYSYNSFDENFNDLFLLDENNGWAVGDDGFIAKNTGTLWRSFPNDSIFDIYAVYFTAQNNGWAVGKDGMIIHFDGTSWTGFASPTDRDLNCIAYSDANTGWIGGENGTMLQFNGSEWREIDIDSNNDMFFIDFSGPQKGFAGGEDGIFIEYDGKSWVEVASGKENELDGIGILDAQHVCAVGENGTIFLLNYSNDFSSPLFRTFSTPSDVTKLSLSELYFGMQYFWRIRAISDVDTSDWSAVRNFFTIASVTNSEPANNATGQMLDVLVTWEKISGAFEYIIELCPDPNFTSSCIFYADTNSFVPQSLQFNKTYYWHVKAAHTKDTSDWSDTWHFSTINTVNLVSPENGSHVPDIYPTLEWTPLTAIDGYQLMYDMDEGFSNPQVYIIAEDESKFTFLLPVMADSTYYWKMRAFKDGDTTGWSPTWSFINGVAPGIRETFGSGSVRLFPNPCSDNLNLEIESLNERNATLNVLNLFGQAVIEKKIVIEQGVNKLSTDVSRLENGVYVIRLIAGDAQYKQRIIINH